MSTKHKVTATMIVAKTASGPRYFDRGATLPADVDDKERKRLVASGLVEIVNAEEKQAPSGGDGPKKPAGNAGFGKHLEYARAIGIEVSEDVVKSEDKDAVRALIEAHEKAAAAETASS